MEKQNRSMFGMGLVRATIAALAISTLAATPHADAQRRQVATAQTSASRAPAAAPATASAEGVVNIQTASVEELQRLPGIGPSKAQAIVAFRERTAFRRVEDILRVRGIGRATFRRLRPMITVTGPTTLTQDVRSPRRAQSSEDAADAESESEPDGEE